MSTSKTIQITQYGGPEVMNLVELPPVLLFKLRHGLIVVVVLQQTPSVFLVPTIYNAFFCINFPIQS